MDLKWPLMLRGQRDFTYIDIKGGEEFDVTDLKGKGDEWHQGY